MKVGFIGLGRMGCGMAARLLAAGHELIVHDILKEAANQLLKEGAQWAESPAEIAKTCDVVFTSLPTPADVINVCHRKGGLAEGFREGSTWIDLTTSSVKVVRELHEQLAKRGVQYLDAPVSGGPGGAASGRLAIWIGGDKTAFEKSKPFLEAMADKPKYIGDSGAGTIAKLAHNMASSAMKMIMGEVMTMGVKAGLEPQALWEAMRSGAAGRQRGFDNITRFLEGNLDPASFAIRLMQKDIGLALELGREMDVPMRMCNLVGQDLAEAMNRGWEDRDSQALLVLQQERSGVPEIRLSKEDIKAAMDRS